MTRRVLLTGATGFLGRQVLRALVRSGASVRAVVRSGKANQIEDEEGVEAVIATPDLFDETAEWYAEACKGIDTVVHVAWYAEPGKYLESDKNLDCLIGTLQLAKGAIQANVRRFVGIGTCFEYDLADVDFLSIDSPLRPLTPYAGSKAAAYTALTHILPKQDVEFAWCRLFYLYGEGEDARRLVPYLHSRLSAGMPAELSNGNQIRDFLDVTRAGKMISDEALGNLMGPVNICSEVPVTVRQIAEKIADEYGQRELLKFGARPEKTTDPIRVVGRRIR